MTIPADAIGRGLAGDAVLRVLSIDGGGIRGIIPATVLVELERLTGRPIADLFDYVAGTSTGGILALALTCPQTPTGRARPAAEIRKLYLEHGAEIFPLGGEPLMGEPSLLGTRTPLRSNPTLRDRFERFMGYENIRKVFAPGGGDAAQGNARYPAAPLERLLQEALGETMMSAALRPISVVSCDLDTGAPLVFRGGGLAQGELGDAQMRHVGRATSAGPTFFPPLSYRDVHRRDRRCVDGGLIANDPAFVAYTDAVALLSQAGRREDQVLLVSIGTGEAVDGSPAETDDIPRLVDQRTWLSLAGPLLKTLASGSGELARQQLQRALGDRYIRIQTPVLFGAVHAMDNVQPANLQALLKTGEALVERWRPHLEILAGRLISST